MEGSEGGVAAGGGVVQAGSGNGMGPGGEAPGASTRDGGAHVRGGTHGRKGAAPRAKVAHRTRGRVRLQFPKEDRKRLEAISTELRGMAHVKDVEVRASTGSLVIQHKAADPEFMRHLLSFVKEGGLFFLEEECGVKEAQEHLTAVEKDAQYLVEHSKAGETVLRYTEHLNRAVKQATDGWVDLRVLLPATVGLIALIVVEVESAPMWLPLALFSYQSFSNLHQPRPATLPTAPSGGQAGPGAA